MHHWIRDEDHRLHRVDLMTWARWFEEQHARDDEKNLIIVKRTHFPDGTMISTCFLGLDHNFGLAGAPVLFETMIFGGGGEHAWEYQERYCTEAEALVGHERARAHVRAVGLEPLGDRDE